MPPPNVSLAKVLTGWMMNAPSTGPNSVPRPPRITDSTISALVMIENMPIGSTKDR